MKKTVHTFGDIDGSYADTTFTKMNFKTSLNELIHNSFENKPRNKTLNIVLGKLDESSYFLKLKNFLIKQKKIKEIYDVETTTVDDYFKGLNLQNTLLKIDVEGHELNVLEGSKNTIKKIDFVLIENQYFDIYKDNNINECHSFLKNNQFDLIKKFRFPTLHFEDRLYKKN